MYKKGEKTYCERKNRDVILNRAKDQIYLKKKKIKRQNMEEIDIIICLKKRNKKKKNIKNIFVRLKSLNLIINKLVF